MEELYKRVMRHQCSKAGRNGTRVGCAKLPTKACIGPGVGVAGEPVGELKPHIVALEHSLQRLEPVNTLQPPPETVWHTEPVAQHRQARLAQANSFPISPHGRPFRELKHHHCKSFKKHWQLGSTNTSGP